MLALAGGCYQGVFRNPLADPYLLGVAAGAGLGVTAVDRARRGADARRAAAGVPLAAFVGALVAVALTYLLGVAGRAGPLAGDADPGRGRGVRVPRRRADLPAAAQRRRPSARSTPGCSAGWPPPAGTTCCCCCRTPWSPRVVVLPCAASSTCSRVGDDEAASLGLHPQRSRYILLAAASLGTAAAVSVSGLIGFVGIIVPHTVRLLAGDSYRAILPLSHAVRRARSWRWPTWPRRTVAAPGRDPDRRGHRVLSARRSSSLVLRTDHAGDRHDARVSRRAASARRPSGGAEILRRRRPHRRPRASGSP